MITTLYVLTYLSKEPDRREDESDGHQLKHWTYRTKKEFVMTLMLTVYSIYMYLNIHIMQQTCSKDLQLQDYSL